MGSGAGWRVDEAQRRINGYATDELGWQEFGRAVIGVLENVVPHDAVCLTTVDPETTLFTNLVRSGLDDSQDDLFWEIELTQPDPISVSSLAQTADGVGILAEHHGGDPMRNARCRELLGPHFGLEHELRSVVRFRRSVWASVALYRAPQRRGFTRSDAAVLAALEDAIASGTRRCATIDAPTGRSATVSEPAILILDSDGQLEQATEAGEVRIAELGRSRWQRLPTAIRATAAAARAAAGGNAAEPYVRAQLDDGGWVQIRAAAISGSDVHGRVAVTIEPVDSATWLELVMAAHGLTERESEVVHGVVSGASTAELAVALNISRYTVQDHLKSVFHKTGVTSRRELVAQFCRRRRREVKPR